MTPSTLVLLHDPAFTPERWSEPAACLTGRGERVVVPRITDADRPPYAARYIARAALEIAAADPEAPLLLVAEGAAGPLVPQVAAAQRAAHRPVAAYVLLDAWLPQPGSPTRAELVAAQLRADDPAADPGPRRPPGFSTEPLPLVQDWPDAPCGYLLTDEHYASCARLAALRDWPVVTATDAGDTDRAALADALLDLVRRL
ncbi:hypothetical protein HNR23_004689 [Nocardiopsis mwathae]|uniref:Alpha/beta hydrolase n=1 Tax=Nocardiopsis mwathae TaxID=1472723 RepID=A0A7W9YMC6_9ACTN|nr:hypothetical protein [Nocardiopsis mwathae]MBB6174629.1 hypothetical protein [Nocardiopsis mwathae]